METTEETEQRFNNLSQKLKDTKTHEDFQKIRKDLHAFISSNPSYKDRIFELFLEVVGPTGQSKSNTSTESL